MVWNDLHPCRSEAGPRLGFPLTRRPWACLLFALALSFKRLSALRYLGPWPRLRCVRRPRAERPGQRGDNAQAQYAMSGLMHRSGPRRRSVLGQTVHRSDSYSRSNSGARCFRIPGRSLDIKQSDKALRLRHRSAVDGTTPLFARIVARLLGRASVPRGAASPPVVPLLSLGFACTDGVSRQFLRRAAG